MQKVGLANSLINEWAKAASDLKYAALICIGPQSTPLSRDEFRTDVINILITQRESFPWKC